MHVIPSCIVKLQPLRRCRKLLMPTSFRAIETSWPRCRGAKGSNGSSRSSWKRRSDLKGSKGLNNEMQISRRQKLNRKEVDLTGISLPKLMAVPHRQSSDAAWRRSHGKSHLQTNPESVQPAGPTWYRSTNSHSPSNPRVSCWKEAWLCDPKRVTCRATRTPSLQWINHGCQSCRTYTT